MSAPRGLRDKIARDLRPVKPLRSPSMRALEQVPADQREALLLHHVQGWSFAEIAARLGIRVNAAKTRAFRGMKKMKGHLK